MQILVITQYFWPENFRINDLVANLVHRKHQVTVLTGIPNYPSGIIDASFAANPEKYREYKGADIVRVPMVLRGKGNLRLVLNYISFALSASVFGIYQIRNRKFDSLFVYEPSPITVGLPAVLLRSVKKAPLIFWVLDLWPGTLHAIGVVRSKFILKLVGMLVSFIYKRCDLILGQSKSFLSHIKEYSSHDRVEYFPSWSESIFMSEQNDFTQTGKNANKLNIVFAGNIGEAQDFPSILDAVELLLDEQDIHWTIVGGGRLLDWLKKQVVLRGLEASITFAGQYPVEKMPEFFQQADALLISLKDEPIFSLTIPGKLQSYLMVGKPILAMLNGEGARLVTESGCGIACNAGNGKCLADAVLKLKNLSIEKRQVMGIRGRELSKTEFDREKLISRLENWMIKMSIDYQMKH